VPEGLAMRCGLFMFSAKGFVVRLI